MAKVRIVLLLFAGLMSAMPSAQAQQQPTAPEPSEPWYDRGHDYVSEWINTVGIGIDQFLSRTTDINDNDSYLRLSTAYQFDSLDAEQFEPKINAKIDLPGTQKKLKLVFDNDSDETQALYEQDKDVQQPSGHKKAVDEQSSAALRWLIPLWQAWQPSMDIGVRAKIPPDPFIRFRLRRSFPLGKVWQFSTDHQLAFYHQEGLLEKSYFTFARPISEQVLWLNTWQLQWRRQENHLEYGYILAFNHFLSPRDRMIWRAAAYYQQRPVARQEGYVLDMRYRRDLYKGWLFAEITPSVRWFYATGFRDQYGLTLRLELLFRNSP